MKLEKDGLLSDEEFTKMDLKLRLSDDFCFLAYQLVVKKNFVDKIVDIVASLYKETTSRILDENYIAAFINKWQNSTPTFQ